MGKILIDPVNRQEGHLGIDCQITNPGVAESGGYRVTNAMLHGQLFRGFELILKNRDPRDAMVITQRICGVCPVGHGTAASQNIGTLLGYKVHHEDPVQYVMQATKPLPPNAARLRNAIHIAQHMMSNILHFYHLVALDYVNPRVVVKVAGIDTPVALNRPFLTPRYDDNYYINTQRIVAIAGTGLLPVKVYKGDGSGILEKLPGWAADPGGAVNAYLTGQYLKALDIRRICHEMAAIFAGRQPTCSAYTPGGCTSSVTQADIDNYQAKLNQVKAFMGEPTDFANGIAGTMMFDTVAAAHLFPEYFWIGNAYSRFMAFGWGEEAGTIPLTGDFGVIFGGSMPNPAGDNRAFARGYKISAQAGAAWNNVSHTKIAESIAGSRYNKLPGGQYPDGTGWKHPWLGVTYPVPTNEYSWLKSPGYDTGGGNYQRFEVGPISRLVAAGAYYAGVLNTAPVVGGLYPLTPVWGQLGPDCATGADPLGAALGPVYALIPGVTGGPNLRGVAYNGDSTLDRIATRTIETRLMIDMAQHFLNQLAGTIGGDGYGTTGVTDPKVPVVSKVYRGYGMTEATRGALSHWITVQKGKIKQYQCVVPTTWNASPRDVNGNPGPAERSLESDGGAWVANPAQPIELPRITHSYDFCLACAVHLITPKGDVVKVDIPALPG